MELLKRSKINVIYSQKLRYVFLGLKIFIILLIVLLTYNIKSFALDEQILSEQASSLKINEFTQEANKYTKELFPELDANELLTSSIKGEIDNQSLVKKILNYFFAELADNIKSIGVILVIIIVYSILKNISNNFENSASEIAFYAQYILIVTIIMGSFLNILDMIRESLDTMIIFMQNLIPILITLMVATGNIVTSSLAQPIILFCVQFISNIIGTLILPIILIGTTLSIVSNISDKVQINKLSKLLKSSTIWIIGTILTVFITLLSLEGTLSSSVDGVTAKVAKSAVSTFVPVVGKILGDAVDSVMGASNILKNAVGVIGVISILSICIVPIIKLAILTITFYIASSIVEPIADKRIIKLLDTIGESYKILLAIVFSVSFIFIIGTTIIVKLGNISFTYR